MLTGSMLCSQSTEAFEPLGAFNQPVHKSHGQLRAALLNELGREFADYFARPEPEADGAAIAWLAHGQGEPRRWVDLPAEEQARLDPVRRHVQDGLAQYRAQLESAAPNSARSNFAKLLVQAAFVPGPEFLYLVGDQPVAAFWGFKRRGAPSGVDPLRLVPGSTVLHPAPVIAPPPPLPTRHGWWWWPLWLLLLLLLLALLLGLWAWRNDRTADLERLLGVRLPAAWTAPREPLTTDRVTTPTIAPGGVASGGVASGGVVVGRDGAVVTGPGVAVPGAGVTGGVAGGVPDGALPGTGAAGSATDKGPGADAAAKASAPDAAKHLADAGKLPPLPAPGAAAAEHGPPLAMPKDAAPGPATFAEGVWRSRSGLLLNGKPAEEYYRFDKAGQGDVTLRTRDGSVQCSGPAQAAVGADRQLTFKEAPTLTCSDGTTVTGAVTSCVQGGGGASCQGTNTSDGSKFDVRIEGVKSP